MESRIRFVLGHYFTQQRRSSPPPTRDGWLGDLASVQRKFSHYTGQVLAKLGTDIGDPGKYLEKQVLSRVSLLIATDISVGTPTLRHHLRGFIAGVKATGGIRVALDNHKIHRNSVFLVMMSMIITNTTSPSFDQMGEEAFFTNEDVYAYCADELMETFPCPTQLFLCIRDINRARRDIAGGQYSTGIVRKMMQAIFRIIASFEPQTWRERYVLPEPEVRFQLAAMYKSATMLYGMMTLAAYAGVPSDASHRIASTEGIVDLALALSQPLGDHLALAWPLMVAGASLGGAPPGKQAVVDRLLLSISQGVYASNGVFFALERLRMFWKSGKTEWDECFSTWQAAIP
ncbi:C6 finger domain protein [Akanthomyces lecanii RCEF 1005]|uniref:C6 finger domain protein n=1 Tax=Akanthomyces lecanii RCEF 1005 TaxID=1081108 RepID=A0A162KDA7_CORDF|nr:C6 finger domain protein [Akanthomyces lecanii RCEF 1005]